MSFRRTATLALTAAALLSGCKKVSQEGSPQELVIAAFNSPICVGSATQLEQLQATGPILEAADALVNCARLLSSAFRDDVTVVLVS